MKNAETIKIEGFNLIPDGHGSWTAKNRKNLILHVWELGCGGCASLKTADEYLYIFDITRYEFADIWDAVRETLNRDNVKDCIRRAQVNA